MTISPDQWRARGRTIDLPDLRVFGVDVASDAPSPGNGVLVLHGFPLSSWTFAEAAVVLARERRVILLDFPGFGFSDKPRDAGYSVFEHADAAIAVARAFGLTRAHLWAHDMGTSVATELLARRERHLLPLDVASVVLMNGGVHVEMSRPVLGQRLLRSRLGPSMARLTGRRVFVAQTRRIFGRPPKDEVLDAVWALLARDDGAALMPATARFMEERSRFRRRWIGALERIDVPALIAWGASDPITRTDIGERLARETPGAELIVWKGLGHCPHMEDPVAVANDVAAFFARVDRHFPSTSPRPAPRG